MPAEMKILWSEGLTLGPQHFQRQDHYHELRLQRAMALLAPHGWGVQKVSWNVDALRHHRLSVEYLQIVFPDGESVDAPDADCLPEPLDLTQLPPEKQSITIYAALASLKPQGGNDSDNARYAPSHAEIGDLFGEAAPIEVPLLRKRPRLMTELDARAAYICFPIMRLHRLSQGGFDIDPSFIAPALSLRASLKLQQLLEGLISVITAKTETLYAMHKKPQGHVYAVQSGDISSWWMLNILNSINVSLLHLARTPDQPPEKLYEVLITLAGGLMSFSDKYKPTDLPPYRHDALDIVFHHLDAIIRDLAATVLALRYIPIRLEADVQRRAFYHARLDHDDIQEDTQIVLAVCADMLAVELVSAVPVRLKLAAPDDLEHIVKAALPGIPLAHMPQVPSAIPVRPDTYYFSVSTKSPLYQNALHHRALSVYAPDGIKDLRIELMALRT